MLLNTGPLGISLILMEKPERKLEDTSSHGNVPADGRVRRTQQSEALLLSSSSHHGGAHLLRHERSRDSVGHKGLECWMSTPTAIMAPVINQKSPPWNSVPVLPTPFLPRTLHSGTGELTLTNCALTAMCEPTHIQTCKKTESISSYSWGPAPPLEREYMFHAKQESFSNHSVL